MQAGSNKVAWNRAILAVFAGILVFAIFTMSQTQRAQALSALTITDKPTFSSYHSGTWATVYNNTAGTSTYFVDSGTSAATTAYQFKSVKINSTGGTTATTTGVLVGGGTTVTSETGSSTLTVNQVTQDSGTSTVNLRTGSTTFAVEFAATGSSALINKVTNSMSVYLKITGAPTGTATIGCFDSAGTAVYTFGTQNVAVTLTTSYQKLTYTTTSTPRTLASSDRCGVYFNGGSAGNTLDVEYANTNVYDSTNSVKQTATGAAGAATFTSQSTEDLRFFFDNVHSANYANDGDLATYWENAGTQESGAFLKWDAGSNVNTGGVKVYWTDTAKIPTSIKLSTSTDDVTYTDRVTITPTVAVGYEWLELDSSYSVRYVKLTVVTWGSANSMAITEMQRLPTNSDTDAWSRLSAVEKSGSTYFVNYWTFDVSAGTNYYGTINIDTGGIINSASQTQADPSSETQTTDKILCSKNKCYFIFRTGGGIIKVFSWNKDLTSFADTSTGVSENMLRATCILGVNGASSAADIMYCINPTSSGATATTIEKITGGAVLTVLGTLTAGSSPSSATATWLNDKGVFTYVAGGTMYTYTLTFATETVSSALYTSTWLTQTRQQFDFDGTTFTAKSGSKAYYASTAYSVSWQSDGTLIDPDTLYIETVNSGTGVMTAIDDTTYYRLSNSLIVSGSGTTWTPRTFSGNAISPVPYTELLNVPLQSNYTEFKQQVFKINCDNVYPLLKARTHYVGSDSDCATWLVVGASSDTIGRILDYSRTATLVHANPLTAYTISLSASSPDLYSMETLYLGTTVDSGAFDSGGALNQYLLFGNCYTMEIIEISSGNTLQTGNLCANGVTTKPIALSGITIPSDWQGTTWSHVITRDYTNSTENDITFTFEKSTAPYTASLYVYNNALSTPTFTNWYNFTNVNGTSVAQILGQNSNQTLYFTLYDQDGNIVIQDVSAAQTLTFDPFPTDTFGALFGLPIAMIFPVLTAAVFPKSLAYFGAIVTVAVIGIMAVFGIYTPPVWFWGMIMPVLAIAVFVGYKRT